MSEFLDPGGNELEATVTIHNVVKELVRISEARDVSAPLQRVWEIISNVDNDPEYWTGLREVKNLERNGTVIEREVKVGFRGNKARQTVIIHPNDSIELKMTSGPIIGTRITSLHQSHDDVKTKIDVSWDFEFGGIPSFAQSMIRNEIAKGTKEALGRIAEKAESLVIK